MSSAARQATTILVYSHIACIVKWVNGARYIAGEIVLEKGNVFWDLIECDLNHKSYNIYAKMRNTVWVCLSNKYTFNTMVM